MIQQIDDFLKHTDVDNLNKLINTKGYTFGWPSSPRDNYNHWNLMFAGQDPDNRDSVENNIPEEVSAVWQQIKNTYLPDYTLIRAYSNAYTYGTEGYIHTDSSIESDRTVVVYLNKEWKKDWAGETVFFNDNDIVKSCLPKFGRFVIFPSTVDHVARSVSRACNIDRRILTFKAKLSSSEFYPLPETKKLDHSGRTLHEHLARTYNLLCSIDVPEYVRVAGGIHSVYGTNKFDSQAFDITKDREKIQAKFGKDAENLAYLFCSIDRPNCLETNLVTNWRDNATISLTEQELEYLRLIEAANLIEQQSSLQNCPEIYKTWTKYVLQKR